MYTADQLADRFGVSRNTIYSYARRRIIPPATGAGSERRYGREHVAALTVWQKLHPLPGDRFTRACFIDRWQSGNRDFSDVLPGGGHPPRVRP